MFGYVEQSKPREGGNYAKFGLNQGVTFVSFKFNPNGGAGNTPKECADFIFKVGDQEFRHRIFPLENIFVDGKLTPIAEAKKLNEQLTQNYLNNFSENLLNIARCYVAEEDLKKYLVGDRTKTFENFVKTLEQLIIKSGKTANTKLDVFLEWQKTIRQNQTKTFLTFATSDGQYPEGICVTKHIEKEFKEVKDDKGVRYVAEDGEIHPIQRNGYYFRDGNKKAHRQVLEDAKTVGDQSLETSLDDDLDLPF